MVFIFIFVFKHSSLTKNKGDLERERDELKAQIDNRNHKIEVLERTIDHLKNALDEKVCSTVSHPNDTWVICLSVHIGS